VELGKYVINRVSRLARKFGQKIFSQWVLDKGPAPTFARDLQQYAATRKGQERLKKVGGLRSDLVLKDVEPSYCENVLSLGMLIGWIKTAASSHILVSLRALSNVSDAWGEHNPTDIVISPT
jgi:hypothetical protein